MLYPKKQIFLLALILFCYSLFGQGTLVDTPANLSDTETVKEKLELMRSDVVACHTILSMKSPSKHHFETLDSLSIEICFG